MDLVSQTTADWLETFRKALESGENLADSAFWRLSLSNLPEGVDPKNDEVQRALSIIRQQLDLKRHGFWRVMYRQPTPQGSWVYLDIDRILQQTETALLVKFSGRKGPLWIPKADVAWWETYMPRDRDGTIWIRRSLAQRLSLI